MKQLVLILSLFFSSFTMVQAQQQRQPDPEKREQKIQALYIAYITQDLKLTEDEAQKFWPVHSQYDSEIKATNLNMSSDELKRQQSILDIKKKYQDKFVKIIGNDRTNAFFRSDAEFRKKLVERLRNMRQQKQQRPFMNKN